MNGVCCIYSMNEERDLREAMRQDIREEWRIQREIEAREREQRDAEVERLLLQSLERRHQKMMKASVGGAECIYEKRMLNHNKLMEESHVKFQQKYQMQPYRIPTPSSKANNSTLRTELISEACPRPLFVST